MCQGWWGGDHNRPEGQGEGEGDGEGKGKVTYLSSDKSLMHPRILDFILFLYQRSTNCSHGANPTHHWFLSIKFY